MDTDVIISGAGPAGLMLAAELRLHGVRVVVLERLAEPVTFSKAAGLHPRSAETMELRGLNDRFTERGRAYLDAIPGGRQLRRMGAGGGAGVPLAHFAGIRTLRLDRLDTNHPGLLLAPQAVLEEVLAERLAELGARPRRGHELTALDQDADGVTVRVAGPDGDYPLRARWLVGCDGGRSTVRRLAGFAFPGTGPTITCRLGDVPVPELLDSPGGGWHRLPGGVLQVLPMRATAIEFDSPPADPDAPMTTGELAAALSRVAGREITIDREPLWMSRYTDNTRQVERYRDGRILLAGDAAHVHPPFGGQGLNLGVQDAVNLGWKLAATVAGWAPDGLLDSYHSERHPVAARVLHNTRAQVALMNPDERITPLREVFAGLMELPEVNRSLAAMISALDVRYPAAGDGLAGAFLPDLAVRVDGREGTARGLLAGGRPVLLDLTPDGRYAEAASAWADRVDLVTGTADAPPAVALLVRPDGYLAWAAGAGEVPDTTLTGALTAWFGSPAVRSPDAAAPLAG